MQKKQERKLINNMCFFPVWSFGFTNPQNYDGNAAFDGKEHDFDAKKPESEVNVSLSSTDLDLSAEFEDCFDNSSNEVNVAGTIVRTAGDPDMLELEDITYSDDENDVGAKADFNNLEPSITVSPIPTTRIHKDHLVSQIIGDLSLTTQTRSMTRVVKDQGGISQMFNDDFHTCMFACFLLQEEPKRVHQALKDPSWIEAMQEDLLHIKMQKLPGFEDPDHPDKVYKVVKALYGLHQAPRAWYETLANYLLENGFQRGKIDQTLFIKKQKGDILLMSSMGELTFFLGLLVKQKKNRIFISQDKYLAEILRKFGLTEGKSASTPIDT
nr:putative ribonuclease H-like domain-containing protein [Tanacetum cinerariifolium]